MLIVILTVSNAMSLVCSGNTGRVSRSHMSRVWYVDSNTGRVSYATSLVC